MSIRTCALGVGLVFPPRLRWPNTKMPPGVVTATTSSTRLPATGTISAHSAVHALRCRQSRRQRAVL